MIVNVGSGSKVMPQNSSKTVEGTRAIVIGRYEPCIFNLQWVSIVLTEDIYHVVQVGSSLFE